MMVPSPFIHIRSTKFPVLPDEEDEMVNEGMYGKALAVYLQQGMQKRGYKAPFVCCEDWGWWVEIRGQPVALGLCVYGILEGGLLSEQCVCVGPLPSRKWSWKQFRFVDATATAKRLHDDALAILENDPEIEVLGCPDDFPLG